MKEIYKVIRDELKKVCDKVFMTEVRVDTFPYITFDIPDNNNIFVVKDLLRLEINIWDKGYDIERILDLVESIDLLLDGFKYNDGSSLYLVKGISKHNIKDPQEGILRRLLRYDIQYYRVK